MDSSRYRPAGSGLSSSAHQSWPHLNPYASPVVETAGPSQITPRPLDESARAYRTTALRQLNGNSKPLSWKSRHANSTGSRSSTLLSQPVLVKSYPGPPDDTAETSRMPSRRGFSLSGSSREQHRAPPLPSPEDFSIEGILRVIEPDIRNTLDSIAEICGRSKLSLANEYASHIAPLGEIRAPPGGLVTVEEASPNHEGELDDNVVIYDDDNSVMDGRDFLHLGYFENIRRATGQRQPTMPDLPNERRGDANPVERTEFYSFPAQEFRSIRSCRALIGKTESDGPKSILTPAVVSEVHPDAGRQTGSSSPRGRDHDAQQPAKSSVLRDLQTLFTWVKQVRGDYQPGKTAEMRLREMLERQTSQDVSQSA